MWRIGNQHVDRARLQGYVGRLLDGVHQLVLVATVKGGQDVCVDVDAIELLGVHLLGEQLLRIDDDILLHELKCLWIKVSRKQLGNRGDGALECLVRDDDGHRQPGGDDDLQGHLRDDAQRTLRPYEQVQKAVPRARLRDRRALLHDLSGRKNDRHAPHVVPRRTILDGAHATRVGRDVAAHGRELLAWIRRIHEPTLKGILGQVLKEDARLDRDDQVLLVIAEDLVHLCGGDHDSTVLSHGATRQCGTSAGRRHRYLVVVADLHDCGDFLGRRGLNEHLRHSLAIDAHLIMTKVLVDLIADEHMPVDGCLDLLKDLRCYLVVRVRSHSNSFRFDVSNTKTRHDGCSTVSTFPHKVYQMATLGGIRLHRRYLWAAKWRWHHIHLSATPFHALTKSCYLRLDPALRHTLGRFRPSRTGPLDTRPNGPLVHRI